MENLSDSIFIIMAVILGVVFAFFMLFRVISNYYIKVPPNFVAVVYGRKNKADNGNSNGYELVTGGSKFILPLIESVEFLELSVMSLEINISNIPNKDGVLVSVQGNANVKILSDLASLAAACERFLGKAPTEIQTIAHRSLEGHLRAIIGKLTIEDIIGDRSKFNQKVLEEAGEDLRKLGLGVDFITIQDITDNEGYLAAIGQKKIAEVKRDGQIGRAEAERETKVRTTTATMEGEKQSAENAAKIAEAEKERDVKKAQYRAETEKEQAKSEQARPLASAQAKKEVIERESEVAIANSEKIANELLSTVVKPAEAQKQADIINAEADKSVTINQAEAQKQKTELEAQGKAAAILAEGQASAKVIQMKLEAEAAGTIKKAEAYKMMDDVGRQMQMIDKIGEVGPGILDGVAKVVGEAAKPLGNVKEIKILDMNGGKNGSSAVANFAQMVPAMLLQMNETMKSAGYDISGLLGKANIKETVTDVGVDQVLKDMLKDLTPEQRELFKNVTPEQIELMKKVFKKSNTEEMKK